MLKKLILLIGFLIPLLGYANPPEIENTLQMIEATLQDINQTTDSLRQHRRSSQTQTSLPQLVNSLKQQMTNAEEEIKADFAAEFEKWDYENLPDLIKQRYLDAAKRYRANINNLLSDLEQLITTNDPTHQQPLVSAAIKSLQALRPPKRLSHFNPEQPAFGVAPPIDRPPFETPQAFQQFYSHPVDSTQETDSRVRKKYTPPSPADLAETQEIQLTDEIKQLAQSLGHRPVDIFNWVCSNIEYLPAHGSIQDAQLTLDLKQGNAFAIASLLIALFRASNIEARYNIGTIEITMTRLMDWLKVNTPNAAIDLLANAAIPNQAMIAGGEIKAVRFEHVWVSAWIDFIPSRGARHRKGDRWVALDPSFKKHQFIKGIDLLEKVPFDIEGLRTHLIETTYTNEFGGVMGIEPWYFKEQLTQHQTQLQAYIDAHQINPEDVLDRYTIIPSNRPTLAAGLPYRQIAKLDTFADIPDHYRHSLTIKLYHSARDQTIDNPTLSQTINLPTIGLHRLSLTYEPATQTDAQALKNFETSNADALPVYLFQVKPVLKLDDQVLATGTPIGMGESQYYSMTMKHPHTASTHKAQATAGDVIVFGVNGNGMTKELVQKRLKQTTRDTAEENMHQAGLHFWLEHDLFDYLAAQVYQVRWQRMPSVGTFSLPLSVRYFFGVPRSGVYKSRQIDIKYNTQVVVVEETANAHEARFNFMNQSGIHGSYLEGSVLDQLFGRQWQPAISATQILMEASERGVPVYTVTSENANTILPILNVSAEVKSDIIHAVKGGGRAIVAEQEIEHGNWKGSGYVLQDLETGSGAYLLEGGLNGGSWEGCEIEIKAKGHPSLTIPVRHRFEEFEQKQMELKAQMELAKKLSKGAEAEIKKIKDKWDSMVRTFASQVIQLPLEFLISGEGCLAAQAKGANQTDDFYASNEAYVKLEKDKETDEWQAKVEFLTKGITACWNYRWEFGDKNFGTSVEPNPIYSYTETGKYTVKVSANCQGAQSTFKNEIEVYIFTVNLEVEGIPDEVEETEGGQIQWNLDRDEQNMALDSGYKIIARDFEADHQAGFRVVEGDDEVLTARLLVQPADLQGTWQIIFPKQVRLFQKKSDATLIELASSTPSSNMTVPTDGIVADLRIEAVDQSQSKRDIVLKAIFTPESATSLADTDTHGDTVKLTSIIGDLTISEIRAVQVIEDVTLVKDKATVARVFVKWSSPLSQLSDGAYLENVKVKLKGIPGNDLTSLPGVAHQYQQATYFRSGAIKIEFTDRLRDSLKYQGGEAITVSRFFPDSIGPMTFQATVDPEAILFESDELNNEYTEGSANVAPFIHPKYKIFWQYARRKNDASFVTQNLEDVTSPLYSYFLSVYPIPGKAIVNLHKQEIQTFRAGEFLLMMAHNLSNYIEENGYHHGIYVVPDEILDGDEGRKSSWFANNVALVIESAVSITVAHEIGHSFGFCDEYEYGGWFGWHPFNPECGIDWNENTYPHGYVAADGWDAEQDDGTYFNNGAYISVNASNPTTRAYNHFSFMNQSGDWITRTNYLTLMDALVEGGNRQRTREGLVHTGGIKKEVPVVRVIGSIYEDGTFELYSVVPSMGYESRTFPGKFAIEWLDVKGQILHRLPFGKREVYYDYKRIGKKLMPMSLAIEEPKNAHRLRIVKDGKELFGINRSPNAPEVQFGKIQYISEQEASVTVTVNDKDGDDCRTILGYAKDQTGPWYGLGESSGIGIQKFSFNPNAPDLPASKTGILRARACDGLNCTNAKIPFTEIADKPPRLYLYRKEEVDDPFESMVRKKKVFSHYSYSVNAYDVEDYDLSRQVRWYDSQGVLVGKGNRFSSQVKIKGLTAKVTDSNGQEVELKLEE